MSDNPVSNVSNRVDFTPVQTSQVQTNQGGLPATPKGASAAAPRTADDPPNALETTQKEAAQKAAAQQQQPTKPAQIPLINRETNLKFQVDEKTHQVTIMIMDRATDKVITTIPPDKIKDVPPGDLLDNLI